MAGITSQRHSYFDRLVNRRAGSTALAASNFALSAGFGTTASVSALQAGATDSKFHITITSAGTGQGANPTCTLTFADGSWRDENNAAIIPVAVASRSGGSQPTVQFSSDATATTCVLTFMGTPVAAETYDVSVMING